MVGWGRPCNGLPSVSVARPSEKMMMDGIGMIYMWCPCSAIVLLLMIPSAAVVVEQILAKGVTRNRQPLRSTTVLQ